VLAKENDVPFYVAMPLSSIDMQTKTGDEIEIEVRDEEEVLEFGNTPITPKKTDAYNPAFDITPHTYITGFITEDGIIEPEYGKNIKKLVG